MTIQDSIAQKFKWFPKPVEYLTALERAWLEDNSTDKWPDSAKQFIAVCSQAGYAWQLE